MERIAAFLRKEWVGRVASAFLAMAIGVVFVLASLLVPSPEGHGTHLQLGLGSCTFLTLTGMPCPMCGATTTFTLMAHLRVLDAFINQPFAAMLFVLSALVFAVAAAEAIDPRARWTRIFRWLEPRETVLAGLFLAAMAAGWVYKIFQMKG